MEAAAPDAQFQANLEGLRAQLMDAKVGLGEQERLVATFYFYDGHTLKDIGKAMNLTEGRISQILKRALGKLRERLKSYPLVSGGGGWQESLG